MDNWRPAVESSTLVGHRNTPCHDISVIEVPGVQTIRKRFCQLQGVSLVGSGGSESIARGLFAGEVAGSFCHP